MDTYLPETIYEDDVFLVSYPKSGNTWLRFLLGNYISGNQCDFSNAHLIMPDIHYNPEQCAKIPRPRIIKSHYPYVSEYNNVIYLVRDGRDVAVSYYFYSIKFGIITQETTFSEFLRLFNRGWVVDFGLWGDHVNSWLDHKVDNFLLIKYEDLKRDPANELKRVIQFCSLRLDEQRVVSAIEASSFERMKKLEVEQINQYDVFERSDHSIPFVRNGVSGESKKFFTERLYREFIDIHGTALQRLNYTSSKNIPEKSSRISNAWRLLNKNRNLEALDIFNEFQSEDGSNNDALFGRAIALVRINRIREGIDQLKKLLEVNPNHTKGRKLLHELNLLFPQLNLPVTQSELIQFATSPQAWKEILSFHSLLASDDYVARQDSFYRSSIAQYGEFWWYLDIVNVLFAASRKIKPKNYLEIGVRRGRSVCVVARGNPEINIIGFDMWIPEYAGMDNPGSDFVRFELNKHGFKGNVTFVDGDSHVTVPHYFSQNPQEMFDLITVDGDHSEEGAFDDLLNVIPHLNVGGILVFDDIAHPTHPYLLGVWKKTLSMFPNLFGYEYSESGYGVAFAIRVSE